MKVLQLLILCCIIGCCIADSYENEKTSRGLYYPRKKGKHELLFLRKGGFSSVYFSPLHGLGFLGGLQSLAAFVILKIKIILVVTTIVGVAFLALKFFGLYKYSNYLYKDNHPIIEGPLYEYGGYQAPFHHGHIKHEEFGNEWLSAPSYSRSSDNDDRSSPLNLQSSFLENFGDLIFSFLNISNENCRERLTCQFEALIEHSPFRPDSSAISTSMKNCTEFICGEVGTVKARWQNLR